MCSVYTVLIFCQDFCEKSLVVLNPQVVWASGKLTA